LRCLSEVHRGRFLGGQRIDPANDGRPDRRPDVRENAAILGDSDRGLRFRSGAAPAADPAHGPVATAMRRAVTCALTPASRVARMPSALAPSPAEVRESLLRRREPISELAADLLELV